MRRRRKSIRDVRSLPATCSRGNRIHQSPTLSCHLLQIKRIICTASKPDIPAGPALKNTKNSTWSQKHKTERAAYCRKTPFDSTNEKVEKKLANIFYIYLNFFIWREKKQIKKKKPKTATTIAEWPLSQLTPHFINLVHFNWIQLCQDLPWLIKHLSAGNEANRKRSVKHILNTVGTNLPAPKSDTCEAARLQTAWKRWGERRKTSVRLANYKGTGLSITDQLLLYTSSQLQHVTLRALLYS